MAGTQNGCNKVNCKMATDGRRDIKSKVPGSLRPYLGCDYFQVPVKFKEDSTARRADRLPSLLAEVVYNDCSIDPEQRCQGCVCEGSMCMWVCVCLCPRGTLIGAISALPHDRCSLFTAETSMPTPAWVVNVRHH